MEFCVFMILLGDESELLLPMPASLVLVWLVFVIWKRLWPNARKLRFAAGSLVAMLFYALSTPAVINLGVRWLEGPTRTVAHQLDALGVPPAPVERQSISERLAAAGQSAGRLGEGAVARADMGAPVMRGNIDVGGMCMPAGDVATVTHALPASGPLRPKAVIVPSSGDSPPNGKQARLDQDGYHRLRAGIEVWRRTGGLLFLMGGVGSAPEYALSTDMRRMALDMGVPASAIRTVSHSRTTWEDINGAARIMREEGMDPAREVLLVTSALHMQRSLAVAHSVGIEPVPLCSDYEQLDALSLETWFPNNGAPWKARAMLHELIGVWYYRLRGRA